VVRRAEIISRAAVEFSVNIIYILAGDRGARLVAYFNHYLDGVDGRSRDGDLRLIN
jgi:hypothetical protein